MSAKSKRLFLVCLSIFLVSCTAGLGPKFSQPIAPETDKAIIYVYRARVAMTGHELPGVKMNGEKIVKMLPEVSYFPMSVTPGVYEFSPQLFGIYKTTTATINAQPGQTYFVQLKVKFGHLELLEANQDEAMAYMATCYMIKPGYVLDSRVIKNHQSSANSGKKLPSTVAAQAQPQIQATASSNNLKTPTQHATFSRLYVISEPEDARIRIMNIGPKFQQGIKLNPGQYHVEVTAPGYGKYTEWISLGKGENRSLHVNLTPKITSSPLKQPVQITNTPSKRVVAIEAPADLSPEEKRYAQMLVSNSPANIRIAAKNIYYRYSYNTYLTNLAEQSLLENYDIGSAGKIHIDAMAWLCKALAQSGDTRFVATLSTVAETSSNRKLRGYAEKSLRRLQ